MPNWCSNFVEVSHEDREKIVLLRRAFRQGRMLDYVYPVPEDLKITAGFLGSGDAQTELERKTQENIEKHGYGNWYDFCVSEWGTKWDVGERGGDNQLDTNSVSFSFDSAWGPPCNAYEKMVEQGYIVRAFYYESGMGFAGVWEDGSDDYYELGGMSADDVEEGLPEELNEMFGISDNMREWVDEEELTEWIKDGVKKRKLVSL